MHSRSLVRLKVPLFVSLLMGIVPSFASENTLADLRPGSMLVFTRDLELDTGEGTIPINNMSNRLAFWNTSSGASCFFIAKHGATSMVERGSAWRFSSAPRYGWNDYLASLKSVTDGRQILMICRKDADEKIPLSTFLEAFNKFGLQVTPALK